MCHKTQPNQSDKQRPLPMMITVTQQVPPSCIKFPKWHLERKEFFFLVIG